MIQITKPFLPNIEQYTALLNEIWDRNILTNNGPMVQRLESELEQYLSVKNISFVTNGTIALQIAIKALGLKGKIITTPFSYVATTSSIVWEGCEPIFVDIDERTLNIDVKKIEEAITPDASGILATHCYGNACDIKAIEQLAKQYKLKVIYDSAHCFGTQYQGKSIFECGDISTTSFHSTKLFHTVEGGALFSQDTELVKVIRYMRNFGHDGPEKFSMVGINGKNSEFHAAMGLCVLKEMDNILLKRKNQVLYYNELLKNMPVARPAIVPECETNYSYYPVIFESEGQLLKCKSALEREQIYPRRYFFPALSKLNYVSSRKTPVADAMAVRVLCLPLFHDLTHGQQEAIVGILQKSLYSHN